MNKTQAIRNRKFACTRKDVVGSLRNTITRRTHGALARKCRLPWRAVFAAANGTHGLMN
jgi:hypothetical protein